MKYKYLIPVFATLMVWGCTNTLDSIKPRQSVTTQQALSSTSALRNALAGVYDGIQDDDVLGANTVQNAELFTNMVNWGGSFTSYTEISDKFILPNNAESVELWIDSYDAINRANKVIQAVRSGTITEPSFELEKNSLEGEALFVRAITYFELIRYFAQPYGFTADNSHLGVPLILEATNDVSDAQAKPARATVAEVYASIIADLQQAEQLLPETNPSRGSSLTAKGYLSRVYMQQRDWANAAAKAQEVISSGKFSLSDDVTAFYTQENTAESIFEVQHTATDNLSTTNGALNDYFNPAQRGDITIPLSVVNSYEPNDRRRTWFFEEAGSWWSSKYLSAETNVFAMRYSEILLNRAEALVELSTSVTDANVTEAITLVNIIRNRAGISPLNASQFATLEAVREAVHLERQKELATEGHYIHDLKRWRSTTIGSSRAESNEVVAWNADNLIFPIPQREIDVNPNLIQNPGY